MKMKKIISIVLTFLMLFTLTACGGKGEKETGTADVADPTVAAEETTEAVPESSEEQITLNVWHQWSNDTNELKKCYDTAVAEYEASHPNVKINTETLDTEAYKTKISAEFAGKASGIDVFYYWGAGTAKKLVEADKLLSLDEYLTDDTKAKITGDLGAFTYGGKTYSVPMFSWYMTMYCNKALFDQAGAAVPTTYDELLTAVEKLSALDGVTPIAAGAKDGWNAAFIYQALALKEVGASGINSMLKGETPFSSEGYQDAADKTVELYNAGAFGSNPLEIGNDDANSQFITGKAAIRIMGSWFANQVYTDDTATIDPSTVVACKLPTIAGKGVDTDYCGGFIESFWVNKECKYPAQAAEFTIFMNEKMGQAAYETGTGFSGWNGDFDESKLNPLFIQIKDLLAASKTSVLAWDTSLDSEPATIHNEQCQTLFAAGANTEDFIAEQEAAINK
jgi:raffinose/stachyose/melibiose transport system substrate-binding protein